MHKLLYHFSVSYLLVKKIISKLKYNSFTLKTQAVYFSETLASVYRTAKAICTIPS